MKLVEASEMDLAEQAAIVDAVKAVNAQIEASPPINDLAGSIDGALKEITGPAFALDVKLGLSAPTFQSIIRNLIVLLSGTLARNVEQSYGSNRDAPEAKPSNIFPPAHPQRGNNACAGDDHARRWIGRLVR